MDFVDEQHRRTALVEEAVRTGLVEDLADVLDAGGDGGQGVELPVHRLRDDMGQGRLAHARRPPEDERRKVSALDHLPQDAAFAHQVPLAHILVQGLRTHPFRQGREHGTRRGHRLRFPCCTRAGGA